MIIVKLTERAKEHIIFLKKNNRKLLARAIRIIENIGNSPKEGIAHPKPLTGFGNEEVWSRRLDQKNRIIYKIYEDEIEIIALIGHYTDK